MRADPYALRRRLHPRSKAARNVRRMIRRMRYDGGWSVPLDERGNRRPATFLGLIGVILQRRAAARKARR